MLASQRNTKLALINAIHESRQRRCKAHDQSNNGTPIGCEFWRVAVDAVEFVHVWYGDVATTSNVVTVNMINILLFSICRCEEHSLYHDDGSHRAKEDCISTQEGQKLLRRSQDFPLSRMIASVKAKRKDGIKKSKTYRYTSPSTNNSSQDLTTTNVDVLWEERDKVVCSTDGIGRNVDTKGDDDQANSTKGRCSTAGMRSRSTPKPDNSDRVPKWSSFFSDLSRIGHRRCCSSKDTQKTNDSEDERNNKSLAILCTLLVCVSCKVGNIESKGRVISKNRVEV